MAKRQTKAEKEAAAQAEAAQEDQGRGRTRGIEAMDPAARFSAQQPHPFAGAYGTAEGQTAEEAAPEEDRTGSVAPYFQDDIDVDSLDTRTDAEIAKAKQAEAEQKDGE